MVSLPFFVSEKKPGVNFSMSDLDFFFFALGFALLGFSG